MISPAYAAHFVPASESPAEAIALSVIVAGGIGLFVVYLLYKRWRRRRAADETGA